MSNEKIMQKILFIINPASGTGSKEKLKEEIIKHVDHSIYEPEIYFTVRMGDATIHVKEKINEGVKRFVAVGGDGTVNEVAKALIKTDCILGIVPVGSGNGLARHLGLPMNVKESVRVINKGILKKMDFGKLNGIPFFCTCGVGFDAHVGHLFAETHSRGFFSYIKSTAKEFFRYKPRKYKLFTKDGRNFSRRAFLVTFANASQYGNNAFIAPNADISDGYLDVCIMRPFPFFKALPLSLRLFNKTIHRSELLETFRTKEVTLKRKKRGEVHFDGEPCVMGKKLKVKIVPGGLNVFVPGISK